MAIYQFSKIFQRLTVPLSINQCWRKWYRKDMGYSVLLKFFSKVSCCTRTLSSQIFLQYGHMYVVCCIQVSFLVGSVLYEKKLCIFSASASDSETKIIPIFADHFIWPYSKLLKIYLRLSFDFPKHYGHFLSKQT